MSSRAIPSTVLSALLLATALVAAPAAAEDTRLAVRVISEGAKFVGTSMGGVLVTVADADTGELLASGATKGSTGDTDRIMGDAHVRPSILSTEGSAVYRTTLDLDEPTRLRITALGPLAQRQAANEVSATIWAVPGKHLDGGDGILLELPGFVVDILAPPSHVKRATGTVELAANVTMMCGCPITPGGLWDADAFEVGAIVYRNGERADTLPLDYAGEASQFAAQWSADQPGAYEVVVFAHDPEHANTGLDRTTFVVTE